MANFLTKRCIEKGRMNAVNMFPVAICVLVSMNLPGFEFGINIIIIVALQEAGGYDAYGNASVPSTPPQSKPTTPSKNAVRHPAER